MMIARAAGLTMALAVSLFLATQVSAQSAAAQPVAFRFGGIDFLDEEPDTVSAGAGAFAVNPNHHWVDTAAELRLEYRFGRKWLSVGPMVGVDANSDGGLFGFVALYTDMRIAGRWIVTPAAGFGAYRRGHGKELGGVFEFHEEIEAAYRFDGGNRIGLKFVHISNAGLYSDNPGSESLLLTCTLPLGWTALRPH